MTDDLNNLVQSTYNAALVAEDDATAAFDQAIKVLRARRPLLTIEQARIEVATLLALEPTAATIEGNPFA